MAPDTKKTKIEKTAKPFGPDEMMLDGHMDRERLLATLDQKYEEEMKKKHKRQDE